MAFRERRSIFSPARDDRDERAGPALPPLRRSSRSRSPPSAGSYKRDPLIHNGPFQDPVRPQQPQHSLVPPISMPMPQLPAPLITAPPLPAGYVGTGYGGGGFNGSSTAPVGGYWGNDNPPPPIQRPLGGGVYGYDLMMGPNTQLPVHGPGFVPAGGGAVLKENKRKKESDPPCLSFLVPNESVPLVIGRRGETIQAIALMTNAYINVANKPYDSEGDCTDRIVRVMRNKYINEDDAKDPEASRLSDHGYFKCVDAITESIKVAFPRIPEKGEYKLIVLVSKERSLKIIGVGGDNIHKIMNATGCHIDIRKGEENQEDEEMTLTGMMTQISAALDRMGEALFDLDPDYTLRKVDEPKKADALDLGNIDDLPVIPSVRINLGKCNMNALVGKDISFTKHIVDVCRDKKRPVDSVDVVKTGDGTTWLHIEGEIDAVSKAVKVAWARFTEMQEKARRRAAREKEKERERERSLERQRREREREEQRERRERQRAEEREQRERQKELERQRERERNERIDRERERERMEREREREPPTRYERERSPPVSRDMRERSPPVLRDMRERSPVIHRDVRSASPVRAELQRVREREQGPPREYERDIRSPRTSDNERDQIREARRSEPRRAPSEHRRAPSEHSDGRVEVKNERESVSRGRNSPSSSPPRS